MSSCFLCNPDERLVYLRSASFFAMLGYGPVGRGYSLIAAAQHIPSMLDLDSGDAEELVAFTERVRARLRPLYGDVVITEHGRVAPCVAAVTRRYEPHCLHAHTLVFPGQEQLDLRIELLRPDVVTFSGFLEARKEFDWAGQYLYAESADRTCQLARMPYRIPRQLFRTVMATRVGEPEFASWQKHPRLDEVEAARRELVAS